MLPAVTSSYQLIVRPEPELTADLRAACARCVMWRDTREAVNSTC